MCKITVLVKKRMIFLNHHIFSLSLLLVDNYSSYFLKLNKPFIIKLNKPFIIKLNEPFIIFVSLHVEMSPLPHNHSLFPNVRSEMAAAVIQHHLEDLCLAIKDPTTIACQLFERRLIDNTSYQAAISPRSLQVGSVNVRTVQMLNAVYQMAVDKHRVDIISMFISILEGIGSTQPVAASMKRELGQWMIVFFFIQ